VRDADTDVLRDCRHRQRRIETLVHELHGPVRQQQAAA